MKKQLPCNGVKCSGTAKEGGGGGEEGVGKRVEKWFSDFPHGREH